MLCRHAIAVNSSSLYFTLPLSIFVILNVGSIYDEFLVWVLHEAYQLDLESAKEFSLLQRISIFVDYRHRSELNISRIIKMKME